LNPGCTLYKTDILIDNILGIAFHVSDINYFSLKKHGLKIRAGHLPEALPLSGLISVFCTKEKNRWYWICRELEQKEQSLQGIRPSSRLSSTLTPNSVPMNIVYLTLL
jgi:hypothetical protein